MREFIIDAINWLFDAPWGTYGLAGMYYTRRFVTDNGWELFAIAVLAAMLYALHEMKFEFSLGWFQRKPKVRERGAMGREYATQVRMRVADAITDAMDDLEVRGMLSPEEANYYYKKLGNILNDPDLLGRVLTKRGPQRAKTLKQMLKANQKLRKKQKDKPLFISELDPKINQEVGPTQKNIIPFHKRRAA